MSNRNVLDNVFENYIAVQDLDFYRNLSFDDRKMIHESLDSIVSSIFKKHQVKIMKEGEAVEAISTNPMKVLSRVREQIEHKDDYTTFLEVSLLTGFLIETPTIEPLH